MATPGKGRESREARERARVYQARLQLHEAQSRRRRRDNLVAGIVGGLVILAAAGAQVAYFTTGPGAPEPTPGSSPSAPMSPSPSMEPSPAGTPAPSTEATPTPTP